MCQRFFVFTVVFLSVHWTSMGGGPSFRGAIFAPGPGGKTVIHLENDGNKPGWVDIANQAGATVTGPSSVPIALINYEKENRPQYILGSGSNRASRKFNFKGVRNISCHRYGADGRLMQVDCDQVVNIIYYDPYPAYSVKYWNDLELT